MNPLPKVTYIIAHHNYQQYLGNAIKSAKNQTYPCHICIIDDSSDDNEKTLQIVTQELGSPKEVVECNEKCLKRIYKNDTYTFISLLGGPFKQAFARNRGIEETWENTDIFAILDADDENYQDKIKKMVEIMSLYPHIGVVYADYDILNVETGIITREYKKPFDSYELIRECIVHSGSIINKEAIESVLENGKCFDEQLPPVEDYDLWCRISKKWMILHIAESLSLVRVHPLNSTNTTTESFRLEQLKKMYTKLGYGI